MRGGTGGGAEGGGLNGGALFFSWGKVIFTIWGPPASFGVIRGRLEPSDTLSAKI